MKYVSKITYSYMRKIIDQVGADGVTDDEIRQIFNMIDKDKSGKLSLRVTNHSLRMMVVVFVVGVVYDVVDKFWQIIDMIDKEEERQAVLVHVVFMLFMVLTRSARSLPRSVSSRVVTDLREPFKNVLAEFVR